MRADVAVIIVTYNSEQQIENCLRSVFGDNSKLKLQVIVLDNHSTDGTVPLIQRQFPDVEVIVSPTNLGFAAGVNRAALGADADYLLLLNPDTIIIEGAIGIIVQFARAHPANGLYGGRAWKPNGELEWSSCWGLPSLWSLAMFAIGLSSIARRTRLFDPESLGQWRRDTVREVGVITGCFLLVGVGVWQRLGGFDETFFLYGEDIDLGKRAREQGFRPIICPDAQLVHAIGQSSATPLHKARLLFRGKATYIMTHWKGAAQGLAIKLLAGGVGLRAFGGWLKSLVGGGGNTIWRGLWQERHDWLKGYSPAATNGLGLNKIGNRAATGCQMISVVIPTFNRRDALLALLKDLYQQQEVQLEVVVVDDHSNDETARAVSGQFPQTILLRNEVNLGPVVSRNRGIREARGEIIVGLDSDVTVPDATLFARVIQTFNELPEKSGIAFRVLEEDGKTDDAPRWWHPAPLDQFAGRTFETNYFSGTAYAFRKAELIEAGLFSEALFQYHEEVEMAYRFMDAGGTLVYVPQLAVLHHPGKRARWSSHRYYHDPRSLILFAVEGFPPLRGVVFLVPRLAKTGLHACARGNLRNYLRGIYDGMKSMPASWQRRRPIRKPTWHRITALRRKWASAT